MNQCKNCNQEVSKKIQVDGQWKSGHKRLYCFNCVPFGQKSSGKRHPFRKEGYQNREANLKIKCEVCCKEFLAKNASHNGRFRNQCHTCISRIRRRERKQIALAYKGGCCIICKYNKCARALEFHHLDPTKKDFQISNCNKGYSFNAIKNELDKCILVCSNCHAEIHDKLIDPLLYK